MAEIKPDPFLIVAIFGGDPLAALDSDPLGEEVSDPVAKAMESNALARALGKSPDASWNESIGDAPAEKPFVKSSEERFAKVSAKIRELFGPAHLEEAEAAIGLAKKVRDEANAEIVASF